MNTTQEHPCHPRIGRRRRELTVRKPVAGWAKRAAGIALIPLAAFMPANAALMWILDESTIELDFDPGTPGNELRISYDVQNNSDPGDANNLIELTLNAGTTHGVYNTNKPTGWTATILSDRTVFSGNGNYIAPSSSDTFTLFSTHTTTSTGTANARSDGLGIPQNFPQQNTLVPAIPEPGSLLLAGLSITLAYMVGRKRVASKRKR